MACNLPLFADSRLFAISHVLHRIASKPDRQLLIDLLRRHYNVALAFLIKPCLGRKRFQVLVPFLDVGIFGWLPMLAGVAMAMSSVTVVGNSILLGRYKPRFAAKKPKEEIYTSDDLKKAYSLQQASR
jgi:hypothetical protein